MRSPGFASETSNTATARSDAGLDVARTRNATRPHPNHPTGAPS